MIEGLPCGRGVGTRQLHQVLFVLCIAKIAVRFPHLGVPDVVKNTI